MVEFMQGQYDGSDFRFMHGAFVMRLKVGDGITDYGSTKEGCEELASGLEEYGYKVRVGCNGETGRWSVAILEVPEKSPYLIVKTDEILGHSRRVKKEDVKKELEEM